MRFFEWIKSLFTSVQKSEEHHVALVLPQESVELMKKIENDKLTELIAKVEELMEKATNVESMMKVVGTNQIHMIQAYKQQEEMLVAVATMHEEMLFQIEQGKIMIVKPQGAGPKLPEEIPSDPKNKKNGSWN